MSGRFINVLMSGAKNQAGILKSFATTPTGPFETVDRMIRSGRSTARSVVGGAGMKGLGGQKFMRRGKGFGRNLYGAKSFNSLPIVRKVWSKARIR